MEVIDIGLNDLEPVSLNFNESKPSVNFGSGIELLMNDKKRSSSTMNLNLGELDSLENELNEISGAGSYSNSESGNGNTKTLSGLASSFFGSGFTSNEPKNVSLNIEEPSDSNIGNATRESIGTTKTWDGFSKLNEIPVSSNTSSSKMTDREKRRKKRAMIKKLEEWYEKGLIKNKSHFDLDSPYEEIEDEYEQAMEDKRKKDSIKLQGWWFMTFINSIEYGNAVFNPFDLNLDGWGEQVSEDLDSYEEIFSELHEKYKGGKLAPEISLLLRVGFSAAVLNFSNKALSSATPAFNDVIKQSPELMRMFTNATVSSMSQASPGFSMANNLMQEQGNRPRGPPPPAPVETKNQPPPQRPGNMVFTETPSNRPDISAGRGTMFREQGMDINNGFEKLEEQQRSIRPPPQMQQQQQQPQQNRPEMRGPQTTDIDNILSGLKTRNVNIHEQSQQETINTEDDSMISISSLKDLQNGNMPKRSARRKSNNSRNTISLDI
uniref:Uncharacterized protein n=1 Tax=viral metagenome TaxID=1070528 RepID=A0A6C0HUH0_9ZZZZ